MLKFSACHKSGLLSNSPGLLSFMISFMTLYMCQVLHVVDFLGSRRIETAPTSIEVLLRPTRSQSDEPSDLRGSLSPTSVYGTWQSQAVTHPIMNRARRCLTSVIEHKPLSERRIPYVCVLVTYDSEMMLYTYTSYVFCRHKKYPRTSYIKSTHVLHT